MAHLGGAATGWYIVYLWDNKNLDLIEWVNSILNRIQRFFSNLFSSDPVPADIYNDEIHRPKRKTKSFGSKGKSTSNPESHQEKLDAILDKIKVSGYDNLTDEEKDFLYNASKK